MKKYIFIFKATLMENLQYVMNIILGFITFFMILFVFINLWQYIYSDSASLIGGYTMEQMIWYVILTEIMWFGGRNRMLMRQINNDIKGGTIAYSINKPYHYISFVIAKNLGETVIPFFLYLGAGMIIGFSFVGAIPNFRLYQLPFTAISFILGIMIGSFISMGISLLSFWVEDATPFHWIYDKMIIVIGTIFPVEVFPAWAQPIIKCSPIYVVNYGPAKLMIDFRWEMAVKVLSVQLIYFIITLFLSFALFQKGVKKLNVNGG